MSWDRVLGLGLTTIAATFCVAQQTKTKVKHIPAPQTPAASGKEMFVAYCAPCHGTDTKGTGPAAAALNSKPADLTTVATHTGGNFGGPYSGK